MLLCEVALGNSKETNPYSRSEDDTQKPDVKLFQSRKVIGQMTPDPKYTIINPEGEFFSSIENGREKEILIFSFFSGVQMPLGTLISNTSTGYWYGLRYNEYIVYDESQVSLRYLIQFRR